MRPFASEGASDCASRVGLVCALGACAFSALVGLLGCVDTALTLVVGVESAEASVQSTADGDVVALDLRVDVRVGRFALSGDDFILPRAALFADGEPIAEINLERPEGFDGRLEPGESTEVRVQGSSMPGAFPGARDLCTASELHVVVDWQAEEQPDDPLDPPNMSLGNASGTATATCD